jgi:hypothetical protein
MATTAAGIAKHARTRILTMKEEIDRWASRGMGGIMSTRTYNRMPVSAPLTPRNASQTQRLRSAGQESEGNARTAAISRGIVSFSNVVLRAGPLDLQGLTYRCGVGTALL